MSLIPPAAAEWHLNGERGISSEAIFDFLTFGATSSQWFGSHPLDPDDFRRCERLLRDVPEFRARLIEMAAVGPEWRRLVEHWSEIAALMEEEVPGVFVGARGKAPRAYALMQSCIEGVPA